jgi:hypothetical protein
VRKIDALLKRLPLRLYLEKALGIAPLMLVISENPLLFPA